MTDEIWKAIPEHDGYEVSNYSRIKKDGELVELKDERRNNHLSIRIKSKRYSVYVLAWEAFNGPIPKGYVIHHIDFNPLNNYIGNMVVMTRAEHVKLHRQGKMGDESFNSKIIIQRDKQGNFIKEWNAAAARRVFGFGIYDCANKNKPAKTAYGFIWEWKCDDDKYKRK